MVTCDLKKTELIDNHLKIREGRDEAWKKEFYLLAADASLSLPEKNIFVGPDGFPYLILQIPEPDKPYHSYCVGTVLDHCLENGLGVVIARDKIDEPDWVFSYGMLWSAKVYGNFEIAIPEKIRGEAIGDQQKGRSFKEVVPESRQIMVGQPSPEYFPDYARKSLREFFEKRLAIAEPKVFLLSDPSASPAESLVFSMFPDQFDDEEQFGAVLYMVRWYLPNHYGLSGIPRDSELTSNFEPL